MIRKRTILLVIIYLIANVSNGLAQQSHEVTGTVTDAITGETLPAVNIVIEGSTQGTTTDIDGNYTLNITTYREDTSLTFSYIGYESKTVMVEGRSRVDVALEQAVGQFDDIVVIGYGTQRRADVTGSITSVSGDKISNQSVANLDNLLQGQAAGVQVQQNSGSPGGEVSLVIRGASTVGAGKEPLYVVDGLPISTEMLHGINTLSSINPNNIESIEILKDASATAIYGARASNGVVLITTKSGQVGKPIVTVNASTGYQELSNTFDTIGGNELRKRYINQYGMARDQEPYGQPLHWFWADSTDIHFMNSTNWNDVYFRTAQVSNYDISVGGGSEDLRYIASVGYFDQDGILINSGLDRYTINLKLDMFPFSSVRIGTDVKYARMLKTGHEGIFWQMQRTQTVLPAPGELDLPGGDLCCGGSPLEMTKMESDRTNNRIIGSVFGEVNLRDNLTVRSNIALDLVDSQEEIFWPFGLIGQVPTSTRRARLVTANRTGWINENTLDYRDNFGENSMFSALLGFSLQEEQMLSSFSQGEGGPTDALRTLNAQPIQTHATSFEEGWGIVSFFGRVNYEYQNKYLFTGTIRRDGSSRFGPENRYANFPSGSIGWRFSEESFMQDFDFISDARIRVGYGITGNQQIGNYAWQGVLTIDESYKGSSAVVNDPDGLPNEDLSWESTTQFNTGLDLSFFNDRLSFVTDYYIKRTNDLLFNQRVPDVTGYRSILRNLGEIENKGFEFSLTSLNLSGEISWSTSFNISFNRNKIISLPGGEDILLTPGINQTRWDNVTGILREGEPMNSFFGYKFLGVFSTTQEAEEADLRLSTMDGRPLIAGDAIWKDINGDGVINAEDRMILGNPNPKFFGGIENSFFYRGFDVKLFVNFQYGNDVLNNAYNIMSNRDCCSASSMTVWENSWKQEGDDAKYPRNESFSVSGNDRTNSSLFVEDGSFIRLKNLTIGYTLPEELINRLSLRNARFYISGQNLLTITNYRGLDPEVIRPDGIDDFTYPQFRSVTLGLNFEF